LTLAIPSQTVHISARQTILKQPKGSTSAELAPHLLPSQA